jgi:uncharacterized protein (DUF1810 family)
MTNSDAAVSRFLEAQDGGTRARPGMTAYENALSELQSGKKVSHWIWFIFPQGPFGHSEMSQRYAITSPDEAREYLYDQTLRSRLFETTRAVLAQLKGGIAPEALLGSQIDCQKLISSLTLFEAIAETMKDEEMHSLLRSVLTHLNEAGFHRCERTLEWLLAVQ